MPRRWIEIRPAFAVGLAVLICLDSAGLCLPFLLAAALHEGGHFLCLRLCRVPVRRLVIGVHGAAMETAACPPRTEALCAAAGPAVNLLLCALFRAKEPVFALLNLLLAAWNLLPVFPLDGGRLVSALLPRQADAICNVCMAALLAVACVLTASLHLGLWPVLLACVLLGKLVFCRRQEADHGY